MMTEVGGGSCRTMKVCGTTESILINMSGNLSISRRKLLHKMKEVCGVISHNMDELIVRQFYVNSAFNLYLHTSTYFHQSKMITFLGSLLQCVGQNLCTNFIQIVIYLYILLFLCVCFINNCLYFVSFYNLHSMTLFSTSFFHELLLNNLNHIHGKPNQLVVTLTSRLPKCVRICSRVLCVYLGRLSSTINIPMVVYFAYGCTANS